MAKSTSKTRPRPSRRPDPLVARVRIAGRAAAALAKDEGELVELAQSNPLRAAELDARVASMKAKCKAAIEHLGALLARLEEIERVNAPDAGAPRLASRNRRKLGG